MMPGGLDQWEHGTLISVLRAKVTEIAVLQAKLARSKAQILRVIADIEAKPDNLDCTANAKRVLSRMLNESQRKPDAPTAKAEKRRRQQ